MKTKPYIKCPLEAALAAKNFGFKFNDKSEDDLRTPYLGDYGDTPIWLIDSQFAGFPPIAIKWNKFYIAPESLPMLKPRAFDLIDTSSYGVLMVLPKDRYFHKVPPSDGINKYTCEEAFDDLITISDIECWNLKRRIIERLKKPFPEIHYEN